MSSLLVLSKNQINFLNLVTKENGYLGKATTVDQRTIKLYLFDPCNVSSLNLLDYMSEEEAAQLNSLKEDSYIYSPYYRLVIRSLEELVKIKTLTLNFSHVFYKDVPKAYASYNLTEERKLTFLTDLNNRANGFDSRCRMCGHIVTMTSCDAYFEYYTCTGENCSYTTKGC